MKNPMIHKLAMLGAVVRRVQLRQELAALDKFIEGTEAATKAIRKRARRRRKVAR